jgi:hypothetical protein
MAAKKPESPDIDALLAAQSAALVAEMEALTNRAKILMLAHARVTRIIKARQKTREKQPRTLMH